MDEEHHVNSQSARPSAESDQVWTVVHGLSDQQLLMSRQLDEVHTLIQEGAPNDDYLVPAQHLLEALLIEYVVRECQ